MLQDGLLLADGSPAINFQIAYGASFPTDTNNTGELFYLTSGTPSLYVYDGTAWQAVGSAGSGSGGPFTITGDVTGTIDGGTDILTLASVSTAGTFGSSTLIPIVTVDAKGRVTSVSTASASGFSPSSNQIITGSWQFSNAVQIGSPTIDSHAATKSYVDSVASGLDVKAAVRAATIANITLSGAQTVDGVSLVAGDRVLVKNQSTGTQNGIYVVGSGAWARASDFDGTPANEVTSGSYTLVTQGTVNGSTGFVLITQDPITIGSTVQTWTSFQAANSYTAGSGISIVGNVISNTAPGISGNNISFNDTTAALKLGQDGGSVSGVLTSGGGLGLSIFPATYAGNTPGADLTLVGGQSSRRGGNVSITGGQENTSGYGGGSVSIAGGQGFNQTGYAGDVSLAGGVGSTSQGSIVLSTSNVERFRINGVGALLLAGVTGTAGQVMTTNSAGVPSWAAVSSTVAAVGSTNAIQFKSGTGLGGTSGSDTFTYDNSTHTLSIGLSGSFAQTSTISGVSGTYSGAKNILVITGGDGGQGGSLLLRGGNNSNAGGSTAGGDVTMMGGTGNGIYDGGTTFIVGGQGPGQGGPIIFKTGAASSVERMRLTDSGALKFANVAGTAGQLLTSDAGGIPTWSDPAPAGAAAAGSLTGTTLASGVVNSSLTSLGTVTNLTATNITSNGTVKLAAVYSLDGNGQTLSFTGASATSTTPNVITMTGGQGYANNSTPGSGGSVTITGGQAGATAAVAAGIVGGAVTVLGGAGFNSTSSGSSVGGVGGIAVFGAGAGGAGGATSGPGGAGGNLFLRGGQGGNGVTGGANGAGGNIQLQVTQTNGSFVSALTIVNTGAATFSSTVSATTFSGSGSGLTSIPATGLIGTGSTTGYVLTSTGVGSAPTWQAVSSGSTAASALTGTTLASNVVTSSLTSVGTLANLTVTGSITGSISGNASTATVLQTARAINGVSFDGSAPITIAAAAGTLTGVTLASGVTASSLTSVGTLTSLTLGGVLNLGGFVASNAAAPSAGTDLTNKNYVDAAIAGLSWKLAVKAATTANITLSGAQTIDGVALVAGDRVLVKNQTTTSTNGIYVVAAGAWTRSTDADAASEIDGSAVYIQQGTTQADTGWTETSTITTVGTDSITYVQFGGSGTYTAGTGISLTGNTFANTGVTSIVAGTNVTISGATGAVTINVSTVAAAAGTLTGTTLASNVVSSSLTSLSTLSALAVTGTTTQTGTINLAGSSSPIQLQGAAGTSGQVLTSAGAGATPTWQTAASGSAPGGADTQVQFNNAGTLSGDADFTWANTTNVLTLGSIATPAIVKAVAGTTTAATLSLVGGVTSTVKAGALNLTGGSATAGGAGGNVAIAGGVGGSVSSPGGDITAVGGAGGGSTSGSGGNISLTGGSSASAPAGDITLTGGAKTSGAGGNGGSITLAGGNSASAGAGNAAGSINLTGGVNSTGLGGNISFVSGLGTTGGYVAFSTGATTAATERFRILANGAWSVGSAGTDYGTSGQVLTSNANAAPTWQVIPTQTTVANIAGGGASRIPYQSAASTTAFSTSLLWTEASQTMTVGFNANSFLVLGYSGFTGTLRGANGAGIASGALALRGGDTTDSLAGGAVTMSGGSSTSGTSGNVTINGGTGISGGTGGVIIFQTGATTTATLTERFRISNAGGWGLSGANFGTAGNVLTSNGNSAPTWQAASSPVIGSTTQIAYNNAGTMAGSANFTFDGTSTVNVGTSTPSVTGGLLTAGRGTLTVRGLDGDYGNNLIVRGGSAVNAVGTSGGTLSLRSGDGKGGYAAGDVQIQTGTSSGTTTGGGGFDGAIIFSTSNLSNALVERFRILQNGAWSIGTGGAAYGTAGQVLTSNANAAPTWQPVSASALANATIIGTTLAAVSLSGIASNGASPMTISAGSSTSSAPNSLTVSGGAPGGANNGGDLTLKGGGSTAGPGIGGTVLIHSDSTGGGIGGALVMRGGDGSGSSAGSASLRGGNASANAANGGSLTLTGGNANGTSNSGNGGNVTITAGSTAGTSAGIAGALTLAGGTSSTGSGGGALIFQTASTTTLIERARIAASGAITFSGGWADTANTTFSATLSINAALVNSYRATLTTNTTSFAIINVPATGLVYTVTLFLTQDATGSRTMVWPTGTKWSGGATPVLTTTAAKTDIITLTTPDGGTTWYGAVVGLNF